MQNNMEWIMLYGSVWFFTQNIRHTLLWYLDGVRRENKIKVLLETYISVHVDVRNLFKSFGIFVISFAT